MLTPSQVLPFVAHDEEPVRDLSLRYLTKAHDPSPVTADDLWGAVDRMSSVEARLDVIRDTPALPQTDSSVKRLLAELDETPPGRVRDVIERAVAALDGPVLRRHRDHILDHRALPRTARRELRERVELSDLAADAAWDRLMALAPAVADKAMSEFIGPGYHGLLDAAELHPELAERAMAMLADADVTDWREVFAADVLARLRHAPATDLFVRKLATDDEDDWGGDAITSVAVDGLVRIGTVAVVEAVAAAFGAMAWGPRLSAADVLGRIKRPESEAAVVRLLEAETDETVRTHLADALCHLCPTDPRAFGLLRPMADARAFDLSLLDLEEEILAAATITGVEIPEAPRWRERLGDKATRRAQRMSAYRNVLGGGMVDLLGGGDDADDDTGGARADNLDVDGPLASVTAPIHRESPKVGRNDPCPCGSGKKYKKCCGK